MFGKCLGPEGVLDLYTQYRGVWQDCDVAAAYFHACRHLRGTPAREVLEAHPRMHELITEIKRAQSWRAPSVASCWMGTAFIKLEDTELHAVLRAAAMKKRGKFRSHELAMLLTATPLIAPAHAELQQSLCRNALREHKVLTPKEVAMILSVTRALIESPERDELAEAMIAMGVEHARRFSASEVATALRLARELGKPKQHALLRALLPRIEEVALDMRLPDIKHSMRVLKEYGLGKHRVYQRLHAQKLFKSPQPEPKPDGAASSEPLASSDGARSDGGGDGTQTIGLA